eukprot:1812726-Alexandrium_andersonii.AAC.1
MLQYDYSFFMVLNDAYSHEYRFSGVFEKLQPLYFGPSGFPNRQTLAEVALAPLVYREQLGIASRNPDAGLTACLP